MRKSKDSLFSFFDFVNNLCPLVSTSSGPVGAFGDRLFERELRISLSEIPEGSLDDETGELLSDKMDVLPDLDEDTSGQQKPLLF